MTDHETDALYAWADSVDRAIRFSNMDALQELIIECFQMCTPEYYFANAPRQ